MNYEDILKFARTLRNNQTPAEKVVWNRVRNRKFHGYKINRQFIIEHANVMGNKHFFIADFYCHKKKLVIEIDGKIHLEKIEYDKIREEILIEMGYNIIRFKNEEVLNNWETVATKLIETIES